MYGTTYWKDDEEFQADMIKLRCTALVGVWESHAGLVPIECEDSNMVFKEHISDGTMVFGVLKIPMLKPKADVHHIIDAPNSSVHSMKRIMLANWSRDGRDSACMQWRPEFACTTTPIG